MRKIVAGLFVSLDGVYEAPHEWHFPYFDDAMGQAVDRQMQAADAMLLGRVTYEEFASYWPHAQDDPELAARMNDTPKYVVSSTLDTLDWQNSTLVPGDDVVAELRKLKAQPGKNIGVTGSGALVRSLLREGLIDELQLLVHPIVVGSGMKRLFPEDWDQQPLKLVEAQTFDTGVLSLTYASADA